MTPEAAGPRRGTSLLSRRTAPGIQLERLDIGTRFAPAGSALLPLVVVLSPTPQSMGWLASHLASRLPAVVYSCVASPDPADIASTLRAVRDHASSSQVDASRLGLVAEDAAASPVLQHAAGTSDITRLALVSPLITGPVPERVSGADGFPATLLQYARDGASAVAIAGLDTRLRAAAVAVRAIDYTTPADGWTRRSRVRRGADRGLDDLVAFFARGLGTASTFRVIPGWDLH